MIELQPEYLDKVKHILSTLAPDCEARIFGSRVCGKARPYSDLDIALVSSKEIDWRRIEAIKQAFSESEIPFLVDVVDWHAISDEFRKVIEQRYELLKSKSNVV